MADEVSAQAAVQQEPEQEHASQTGAEPSAEPAAEPPTEPATGQATEQADDQKIEQRDEQDKPAILSELETILEHLMTLAATCENTLEATASLDDQEDVQEALSAYSHSLENLPKALQLLNDYRRHGKLLTDESQQLQEKLVALRGGEDDALSSEESRILYEALSGKDSVVGIITELEKVMAHIRQATHPLIALISYHEPGFDEFAPQALQAVGIPYVSEMVHRAVQRIHALHRDLEAFEDLKAHARYLEDVSEAS